MTFSSSLRHSINCDFVEPLRIRVRFTDGDIGRTWSDGDNNYNTVFAGISISEAKLICEYRRTASSPPPMWMLSCRPTSARGR
jgi:hypothetical protein